MATKYVNFGPFGRFIYDDATEKAVETDGDIEAANFVANTLSANVRKLLSNANKQLEEVNTGFYLVSSITSVDSPYTAGSEEVLLIDASGGNITVNLPAAADNTNVVLTFKRTDSSSNTVTVDANGTELIEDEETKTLVEGDAMRIVSDGTQWWII